MHRTVQRSVFALTAAVTMAVTVPMPAQSKPLTKVVFALDFIPLGRHAPWYAAKAEGFFRAEGLDVTIIPSHGGAESIQAVASGRANLGFMGVPELALARSRGAKIKLVTVDYQKEPIAVFSLKSGADVTTARQLEGLTLGSGAESLTPKILRGYMVEKGLNPKTFHVVDIAPSARAGELLTKKVPSIEFYAMSKPGLEAAAKAHHEKLQTFLPGDHGLDLYSNGIGAKEEYLAKHPEIVKRFVRAAMEGWRFALRHPNKAARDEIKYIPTLRPGAIKAELKVVRDLAVTPDVEKHGFGWFDPAKMKADLNFAVKYMGVHGAIPKPTDLYATGYLPNPPIKP